MTTTRIYCEETNRVSSVVWGRKHRQTKAVTCISVPQIHHFLQLVCCSLAAPHTFTRPSSYFRIAPLTQTTALARTQTFFSFHKPSDNLSDFTAQHIYITHRTHLTDLIVHPACVRLNVCLRCKCLCVTCQTSQNQICYFHRFRAEKQIGRKPQKCRQSQHHHLKRNLIRGGKAKRATKHERLFWNINTLTPSLPPPASDHSTHGKHTYTHTNCYLQESVHAHVALIEFTWGLMWVTDQKGAKCS